MTDLQSHQGAELIEARLVEELTDQLQIGGDVEAFILAHPEHEANLRRLLPAVRLMADLSGSKDADAAGAMTAVELGELGDFRIIREVGRGGMGIVYEAEQISLRRRVALKVLPFAATMDPKQLQRFRNEALAAASLHHEHIVPVHAVGCERGVHYYAMQFVDGHTLANLITAPPGAVCPVSKDITTDFQLGRDVQTAPIAALSTRPDLATGRAAFRQAADWIAQAADALEYAHSMGIVHRDVKPGNLMVDAAGKLWVADFGLARFGPDAGLTMSGDLLGTLRYMAPEQALAQHGLVDHRVDIYGLGCSLYELLTGKPAVGGTDKAEIVRHIAFEEPIAPRKLDKAIPAELETIALKCLAKNSAERYATAGELSADLRRFLEDKAIKAKPPTRRQRLAKLALRHRGAVRVGMAALGLAVVALAVFTAVVVRQRNEIEGALGQAKTNLTIADKQRQRASQAVDDMYTQVAEKWLQGTPRMGKVEREFLEKALQFYEDVSREEGDSPHLVFERAKANRRLGMILSRLERASEAEAALRRAIAELESIDFPGKQAELALQHRALAAALAFQGRFDDAVVTATRALALFANLPADEAAKAEIRDQRGRTFVNLSFALWMTNRREDCERVSGDGVAHLRSFVADFPDDPKGRHLLGSLTGQQALAVCALGDPERGCKLYEQAIREQEQAVKLDPRNVESRLHLSMEYAGQAQYALERLDRLPEAIEAARKSLAITEQLAADFPDIPHHRRCMVHSMGVLGEVLSLTHQYAEPCELFRRSVAVQDELLAANPALEENRQMASSCRMQLASALYYLNRNVEAVTYYREAFRLCLPRAQRTSHRSLAASAAARAGCGLGTGADKLDESQRAEFRKQSLEWLTAQLVMHRDDFNSPKDRPSLRKGLEKIQALEDFAGVRDAAALAKLPEPERAAWEKFWAEIRRLLKELEESPAAKTNSEPMK